MTEHVLQCWRQGTVWTAGHTSIRNHACTRTALPPSNYYCHPTHPCASPFPLTPPLPPPLPPSPSTHEQGMIITGLLEYQRKNVFACNAFLCYSECPVRQ